MTIDKHRGSGGVEPAIASICLIRWNHLWTFGKQHVMNFHKYLCNKPIRATTWVFVAALFVSSRNSMCPIF